MAFRSLIENTILPFVAKPNRYIGNFVAGRSGRFASADLRVIVVHPDAFESGLADRETRAAYGALNTIPGVAADLAFLPWPDLAAILDEKGLPVWGLESFRPLAEFDVVLFTPSSVLQYVPMLRVLSLSGIPILREERAEGSPIIAAIGNPLGNPAPLLPFVDAVLLGESEAALPGFMEPLKGGGSRGSRIASLERPERAAIAAPGRQAPDPGILPLIEAGHDGLRLEIRRGGTPHRFESGWRSFLPAWELPVDLAVDRAEQGILATGFDRIEFTGDAPWNHSALLEITENLMRRQPAVKIALPDFGTREPGPALAREVIRGRRTSFGWSPMAGSARLQAVLNHEFDEALFLEAISVALRGGCHTIRLKFGIGWPGETDADVMELARLVKQVRALKSAAAPPRIQVNLVPFVPRPHSPFQWESQLPMEALAERIAALKSAVEQGPVQVKVPPLEIAAIETVLARGGSAVSRALPAAMRRGAAPVNAVEAWTARPWLEAFSEAGIDLENALKEIPLEAALPWDGISVALPREVLMEERARSLRGERTDPTLLVPAARTTVIEVLPVLAPAPAEPPAVRSDAAFGRSSRRKSGAGAPRQASRYRVRFSKGEEVRFTAHLDVARAFERALRRLATAPGAVRGKTFKLSFGPPLPLGMTGEDEYLDLSASEEVPESAFATLTTLLPAGLSVQDIRPIRASVESLCQAIDTAIYQVGFPAELSTDTASGGGPGFRNRLETAVARALALPEIWVPKDGDDEFDRVDARPTLLAAEVSGTDDVTASLKLHLALGSPGNVRPEALIPPLTGGGFDPRLARIHRLALRISGAGKDFSPLEVVELDFPWWKETLKRRAAGQRP